MDICVNPQDANEVHIAGILTWRSLDGGTTFENTSDWIPEHILRVTTIHFLSLHQEPWAFGSLCLQLQGYMVSRILGGLNKDMIL